MTGRKILLVLVVGSSALLSHCSQPGTSSTAGQVPNGTYVLSSVTCGGTAVSLGGVTETYAINGSTEVGSISDTSIPCSFSVSASLTYAGTTLVVAPSVGQECSPNSGSCAQNCQTSPTSTQYTFAVSGTGGAGTTVTLTSYDNGSGLCGSGGVTEVDTLTLQAS